MKRSFKKPREAMPSMVGHYQSMYTTVPSRLVSTLYLQSPLDWALLLKTSEPKCNIQSQDVLYDMILKTPEVGEDLISRGLLDDVFNLKPHPHPVFNATRFRFLSKMYTLFPNKKSLFSTRQDIFAVAMQDAITTNDPALRAYSLQYLSLLTADFPSYLEEFVEVCDLDKIFSDFLKDMDVDVQNNSLEILKNVLSSSKTKEKVPTLINFKYKWIFTQVGCPYPTIQNNALDVLYLLVATFDEKRGRLQKLFNNSGGLDLMFTILFIFHWRDLHPKCLKILQNLAENISHILDIDCVNGIQKLIKYITFIEEDELQHLDLHVLVNVAKFPEGRLAISRNDALPVLSDLLINGSEETKIITMEAFRLIAQPPSDLTELSKNDPVPILLRILKKLDSSKELCCCAAKTLYTVVKEVPVCAFTLSERKNFSVIETILNKTDLKEYDLLSYVLNTILAILRYPIHIKGLINLKLMKRSLFFLIDSKRKLIVSGLEILKHLLSREKGRFLFLLCQGVNAVMKILFTNKDEAILEALGSFFQEVFKDFELTQTFIAVGISSWFQLEMENWKHCTEMQAAFEILLETDLSVKFALQNRLDLWNITRDWFHVDRAPIRPGQDIFQCLYQGELEQEFIRTIYYVFMDLDSTRPIENEDSISLFNYDESNPDLISMSELPFLPSDRGPSFTEPHFKFSTQADVRLLEIYGNLKSDISNCEIAEWNGTDKLKRRWVEEMSHLVGEAVAKAMGGDNDGNNCTNHTLELHLCELKEKFAGNALPIGSLKVGLKLERAILFKVLADRLDFPCALRRGDFATGWVEVAVPVVSDLCSYKELPLRELKTNFIVDLMDSPGRLIPLESGLANEYCSEQDEQKSLRKKTLKAESSIVGEVRQKYHIEIE